MGRDWRDLKSFRISCLPLWRPSLIISAGSFGLVRLAVVPGGINGAKKKKKKALRTSLHEDEPHLSLLYTQAAFLDRKNSVTATIHLAFGS